MNNLPLQPQTLVSGSFATARLKSWLRVPERHSKIDFDRSGRWLPPTLSLKKAFHLSGSFYPAVSSQLLAASNVPRKRRLGQPGENPDGVAKIDRVRMGASNLPPEKHDWWGKKAIRLGSDETESWLLENLCPPGQGKLPLSPTKQVGKKKEDSPI